MLLAILENTSFPTFPWEIVLEKKKCRGLQDALRYVEYKKKKENQKTKSLERSKFKGRRNNER